MTLKDHFHLKKDSFSIDNREDASVYFGGSTLNSRLRDRLEDDFVRPRQVPKFCIYGAFGAGKTHTENHIVYLLQTDLASDYPTEPISLDISPIRAKEKWIKVHGDIVNAIGLDLIREAATAVLTDPAAAKDPVKHLTDKGVLRYRRDRHQVQPSKGVSRLAVWGSDGDRGAQLAQRRRDHGRPGGGDRD